MRIKIGKTKVKCSNYETRQINRVSKNKITTGNRALQRYKQ